MDYTHFVMGFSRVDVCFALPGWHAASLPAAFPRASDLAGRLCAGAVVLRAAHAASGARPHAGGDGNDDCGGGGGPVTVFITALQPTKRGAWCRTDRKKRCGYCY